MEAILKQVQTAIQSLTIEHTGNFVYQIVCADLDLKNELKRLFTQGDSSKFHTVVEINLSGKPEKKKAEMGKEIIEFKEENLVVRIWNSPLYIYGRYIKLSRNMTQTPLKIKGKLKADRSVSDMGYEFQKFFNSSSFKFMGCGREDMDVRCLEGRPFIIELSTPKANLNATDVDLTLYPDVFVKDCHLCTKECKDFVNKMDPSKIYNILIFSDQKINFQEKYELSQQTPLRVLHRRADLIRNKAIEILQSDSLEADSGYYYDVTIKASSGAYIKEWVNGDFGRTIPNLGADCLELDVVTVDLKVEKEMLIRPLVLHTNK